MIHRAVVLAALLSTLAGGLLPATSVGSEAAPPAAVAIARPGPDALPAAAVACWGWYEGPQGRDGTQPCPADVAAGLDNV